MENSVLSTNKSATVEIKDYKGYGDDLSIPAYEVSSIANPTAAQKQRGKDVVPSKQVEVNLKNYSDGVLVLQNVDEDGKFIQVGDTVDLSFTGWSRSLGSIIQISWCIMAT